MINFAALAITVFIIYKRITGWKVTVFDFGKDPPKYEFSEMIKKHRYIFTVIMSMCVIGAG